MSLTFILEIAILNFTATGGIFISQTYFVQITFSF